VSFAPFASFFGPPLAALPLSIALEAREQIVLDDAQLVVQVLAVVLELVVDDLLGRLSRWMPSRVKTLDVDHAAGDSGGHPEAGVLHVGGFSPKIARSSFSSGVSWVSRLGVTLPTSTSPASTSAPM